MIEGEVEDTQEEVITGDLWKCSLYQVVAVRSFPVKR